MCIRDRMKLPVVTPVAEPTLKDNGPEGLLAFPPWHVEHRTDSRNVPKVDALSGAGPMMKFGVRFVIVIAPATLNSRASPAPVPTYHSDAAKVSVTVTNADAPEPLSVMLTVPNGPVPHPPEPEHPFWSSVKRIVFADDKPIVSTNKIASLS